MPDVLVAGGDGLDAVGAVVDGECQRVGAGAVVGIGVIESVGACCCVGYFMPCVAVTYGFGIAVVGTRVNGQIEGVHIGATRTWLRVVICVNTRSSVFRSVPIIVVAGCDDVGSVIVDADIQMQGVGARTAVSIEILIRVCT